MRRLVVLALLAAAAPARADWMAGGDVDPTIRYATQAAEDPGDRVHQLGLGVGAHALFGSTPGYLTAVLDLEVGAEAPGFVYGLHLLPLGVGLGFGERSYLGVAAGGGLSGVATRVPFAGELDAEAFLAVDLGSWLRLRASARAAWVSGDARDDGAPSIGFADELELRLALAVAERSHEWGMSWSDGTSVGVTWREQLGERYLGVSLALDIGLAN
jgi:hypothetical protein